MADAGEPGRPSFSEFWKKSSETLGLKKLRFVEGRPGKRSKGSGSGSSEILNDASGDTAVDKAQIRRAQVRRAQVQHRERKANYVRQLEMDVARIRDMIEATEKDTKMLLDENKAMREQLLQVTGKDSLPLSLDQEVSLLNEMPQSPQLSSDLLQDPGAVTVTLGFDEVLNAPAFYISNPPPPYHPHQSSSGELPPSSSDELPDLTPAQCQAAINFILALEHICRAHFLPCLYDPNTDITTPVFGFEMSGHTLMATSVALRNAPEHIFDAVARTDRALFPDSPPLLSLAPIPATTTTEATTQPQSADCNQILQNCVVANTDDSNSGSLSWTTTALTLRSLHGLASSLLPLSNPESYDHDDDGIDGGRDDVELAPVQAFFELARRFGAERLLCNNHDGYDGGGNGSGTSFSVLDALKRELVASGAIRCPHFGALIDREAFEGAVQRVLGTSAA